MANSIEKIPDRIGYYLAGFADGQGSFNLSFQKRRDEAMPWKISLYFKVTQQDKVILALYKRHLKCGTLRQCSSGIWYYEVSNFNAIRQAIIPFFCKFGFLSAQKKRDFEKFQKLAGLILSHKHLTKVGVEQILKIRKDMNDDIGKRKYSDAEILDSYCEENPQRLHAKLDSGIYTGSRQSES